MKQKELEELLWKHSFQDEEFLAYLQEHPIREIEFLIEESEVQKETGKFTILENSVLEYMEEFCAYDADFVTEEREAKVAFEMKKVLYHALFYFKEGLSYMDLVQEGMIGLLKGIDLGSDCLEAWIVREIYCKVQAEIQDIKYGFKNFLKTKREEAEHKHHHHHHHEEEECSCGHAHEHDEEHECSCGHQPGEEHECCGKHGHHHKEEKDFQEELLEGKLDKNQILEKLLESDAAIDEMERIIEDSVDFHTMKYRLYPIEIEVLNYYFGLMVEKRHSIFEIEEKFHLERDHAQNIFENALYKLSTVKGKLEL